jgi:excisionase family DNA binding protein
MYNEEMSLTAPLHSALTTDVLDVAMVPASTELTVTQAARLLRTSEGYVNEMLNAGHIPFHTDCGERLIQWNNLWKFEKEQTWVREGLEEIVRLSEEMGLYDD